MNKLCNMVKKNSSVKMTEKQRRKFLYEKISYLLFHEDEWELTDDSDSIRNTTHSNLEFWAECDIFYFMEWSATHYPFSFVKRLVLRSKSRKIYNRLHEIKSMRDYIRRMLG